MLVAIGVEQVVFFALVGVLEDFVGLEDVYEPGGGGGVGVDVGVKLLGSKMEGFADLFELGGGSLTQCPIIIGERSFGADHAWGNVGPVGLFAGFAEVFDVVDEAGAQVD